MGDTSVADNPSRWSRLAVDGELDIETAPQLRAKLDELLVHSAVVEVDLSAVTFIDSAGLGALVGAAAEADSDHTVVVTAASYAVESLLELTGTRALFERGGS